MNAEEIKIALDDAQKDLVSALGTIENLLENFPDSRKMTEDENRLYDAIAHYKGLITVSEHCLGKINSKIFQTSQMVFVE